MVAEAEPVREGGTAGDPVGDLAAVGIDEDMRLVYRYVLAQGTVRVADVERDVARRAFGGQITEDELRRPVVLYCAHGFRSLLAGDVLKRMGFENVVSLRGGLEAWQQRGGVVERL